ncbi:MAG: hypothetical protein WC692_04415 [Erythrobacter sp.]|jgi:hypothetical protein
MYKQGNEIHLNDIEASGGSKEGVVRWVLAGGLLLALLLMSVVWIVPALIGASDENAARHDRASEQGRPN